MNRKIACINTIFLNVVQTLVKIVFLPLLAIFVINQQINISSHINRLTENSSSSEYWGLVGELLIFVLLFAFIFKTVLCLVFGIGHLLTGMYVKNELMSVILYFISTWFIMLEFIPLPFTIGKYLSIESIHADRILGGLTSFAFIPFIFIAILSVLCVLINIVCCVISIVKAIRNKKDK